MTYLEQQQKGQQLLAILTQKSWESPTFKEQLINNPVAAIGLATGKDVSFLNDKKIIVEDQTDSDVIYINIPAQPNLDDMQLTEEELEMIAGGVTPFYVLGAAIGFGLAWGASHL
jgi:class IIb bacteriocin, lactobin A/cerein 7B family